MSEDIQNTAVIKQNNGKFTVKFAMPAGETNTIQFRRIAKAAQTYGEGGIQVNFRQSFEIRDVEEANIPKLTYEMILAGVMVDNTAKFQNIVACPGADQCSLGVVRTLNVAKALDHHLLIKLEKTATQANMAVNLSGCANGCTHPLINDIGIVGAVGRVNDKKTLGWDLYIGGKLGEEQVIGTLIGFVEQTKVYAAVENIVDTFLADNDEKTTMQKWLSEHYTIHKVTDNLRAAGLLHSSLAEVE